MGLKIFAADFFSISDGGKIFLFLLKRAFKTKLLPLFVWKELTAALQ